MRAAKRAQRNEKKALDWLAKVGIDEATINSAKELGVRTREEKSAEAEAVLSHLEQPLRFITYNCKRCGEPFSTNYRFNKHCSDNCRKKALAEFGIDWNSSGSTPTQRWGGEPPLTIPAEAQRSLLRASALQLQAELSALPQSQNQNGTSDRSEDSTRELAEQTSASLAALGSQTPNRPQSSSRPARTNPALDFPELDDL